MRKKINNFFKTQIILTHIIANIHSINSVQFILYRKNAKFQSEFFSTTSINIIFFINLQTASCFVLFINKIYFLYNYDYFSFNFLRKKLNAKFPKKVHFLNTKKIE